MTAAYPVDLHTHTTRSDGRDTPQELLRRAAHLHIRVLAVCDHDVRPPLGAQGRDLKALAEELGVIWLPGCEFSCDTLNEDVHLVALGCRWEDAWFASYEESVRGSKEEGYRRVLEALSQNGMPLRMEEVLEEAGIADAPQNLQKKHIFEAMARRGYAASWKEAKALVQQTPSLNWKRTKPDPVQVIREVHRAGGLVVLAHPYLIAEHPLLAEGRKTTREQYIRRLIRAGLDGIEARYTYDKTSYRGTLTKEEIEREVRRLYPLPILSGGSDYHADAKAGAPLCRELGEAGLSEEEFWSSPLARLAREAE